MKTIQKIYISGLGAIGSSYAGKFHEMNPACIKVVLDKARLERYTKDGYYINGKQYSFTYIRPDDSLPPADLILIAVKQHHLEQCIQDIKKFVGPDTIILSLLNGIISEEILANEFGSDKVLYSFCVGTDAVRKGTSYSLYKHWKDCLR